MKVARNSPCPCGSGSKAKGCCLATMTRGRAGSPVELLRARYVAYGAGDARFLIATTDPAGAQWRADRGAWEADLRDYCARLSLGGLAVVEEGPARVRYAARLVLDGRSVILAEDARYRATSAGWLYVDGDRWEPDVSRLFGG